VLTHPRVLAVIVKPAASSLIAKPWFRDDIARNPRSLEPCLRTEVRDAMKQELFVVLAKNPKVLAEFPRQELVDVISNPDVLATITEPAVLERVANTGVLADI